MGAAGAMAGASVGAGLFGAVGSIMGGYEAKRTAYAQANRLTAIGQDQVTDIERRKEQTIATQRASFASRGVAISGSPLALEAETTALALRDTNRVKADVRFQTYELRRSGNQSVTAGYMNAIGGLIGSAAGAGQAVAYGSGGYAPRTLLGGIGTELKASS